MVDVPDESVPDEYGPEISGGRVGARTGAARSGYPSITFTGGWHDDVERSDGIDLATTILQVMAWASAQWRPLM